MENQVSGLRGWEAFSYSPNLILQRALADHLTGSSMQIGFAFSRDDKQCGFVVMPFQDVNRLKSGYPVRRLGVTGLDDKLCIVLRQFHDLLCNLVTAVLSQQITGVIRAFRSSQGERLLV